MYSLWDYPSPFTKDFPTGLLDLIGRDLLFSIFKQNIFKQGTQGDRLHMNKQKLLIIMWFFEFKPGARGVLNLKKLKSY